MSPQPTHSDLHSAQSAIFNCHVYKSLSSHAPHSTKLIGELYELHPAWYICLPNPDALHVCATYPWASNVLVFADGSAYYTGSAKCEQQGHYSSCAPGKTRHAVAFQT